MSQKRSETSAAQSTQWHLIAGFQDSTSASCERTARSELSGRCHTAALGKRQTVGMGCRRTRPDTYADSHLAHTATNAGQQLTRRRVTRRKPNTGSWPTATSCTNCHRDSRDLEQPSSGIGAGAGPSLKTTYLFQRLSVALQWGNAVSFHSTFTTE